jgi:hypothetical protein
MTSVVVCRVFGVYRDIQVFKFLDSIRYALAEGMLPFGAIVVCYSDPVRDKSFQSKLIVTGVMLVLGVMHAALILVDLWRYYDLWLNPGHQIILQVRF